MTQRHEVSKCRWNKMALTGFLNTGLAQTFHLEKPPPSVKPPRVLLDADVFREPHTRQRRVVFLHLHGRRRTHSGPKSQNTMEPTLGRAVAVGRQVLRAGQPRQTRGPVLCSAPPKAPRAHPCLSPSPHPCLPPSPHPVRWREAASTRLCPGEQSHMTAFWSGNICLPSWASLSSPTV